MIYKIYLYFYLFYLLETHYIFIEKVVLKFNLSKEQIFQIQTKLIV